MNINKNGFTKLTAKQKVKAARDWKHFMRETKRAARALRGV